MTKGTLDPARPLGLPRSSLQGTVLWLASSKNIAQPKSHPTPSAMPSQTSPVRGLPVRIASAPRRAITLRPSEASVSNHVCAAAPNMRPIRRMVTLGHTP